MCQWQAESVNSYLNAELMELARKAQVPKDQFAALTDGLHCNCGFDLGKRIDLSGAGAVFTLPDGRIAIKAHGFLPENSATRHEHTGLDFVFGGFGRCGGSGSGACESPCSPNAT